MIDGSQLQLYNRKMFQINDYCYATQDKDNLKFDPPVYKQRYGQVITILQDEKWKKSIKKIVDFGCAEFGVFLFFKQMDVVEEILFVDIEEDNLKENVFKLRPLICDHLSRRPSPLKLSVLLGSVADPDFRLENVDAVTAIELIEHLYPDNIEGFVYNIFSYIGPKLVIVTTPNADFNVVIPNLEGFRHADHKFEWTRQEFEDWAKNIVLRFPEYDVVFTSVGCGPEGTEKYGFCSQIAVFIKTDDCKKECFCQEETCKNTVEDRIVCFCKCCKCQPRKSFGICTYLSLSKRVTEGSNDMHQYYKLLEEIEYPFYVDTRSKEEKCLDDVRYSINSRCYFSSRFYNEDLDRFEIPVEELCDNKTQETFTLTDIRFYLSKLEYKVEDCETRSGDIKPCVIVDGEYNTNESEILECNEEPQSQSVIDGDFGSPNWDGDSDAPNWDGDSDAVNWDCGLDSLNWDKSPCLI